MKYIILIVILVVIGLLGTMFFMEHERLQTESAERTGSAIINGISAGSCPTFWFGNSISSNATEQKEEGVYIHKCLYSGSTTERLCGKAYADVLTGETGKICQKFEDGKKVQMTIAIQP